MQQVLSEPSLKLERATETRWLYQNAVDALRRCIKAVYGTLEQEAVEGVSNSTWTM